MSERGSSPIELALGALLILVPVAVLVLSFGPWLERRSFVRLAAREAARYYVLNDGASPGPFVEAMAATYGVEGVRLGLCGADPVTVVDGVFPGGDACPPLEAVADLSDGGGVAAVVEVDVPVFLLPWNSRPVGGLAVSAAHTEYVDLYRSFP